MKMKSIKLLSILFVMSLVICLTSAAAFADTTSVTVKLNDSNLESYTSTQLNAFNTTASHDYSTYDDCHSRYRYYTASGPEMEQVFNDALTNQLLYDLDDVVSIEITASDNYSVTLSKSSLLDTTRYYYPDPEDLNDPGITTVPAIIATQYGNLGGSLSTNNCLRNFYGQTNPNDYTILNFVSSISEINLITN